MWKQRSFKVLLFEQSRILLVITVCVALACSTSLFYSPRQIVWRFFAQAPVETTHSERLVFSTEAAPAQTTSRASVLEPEYAPSNSGITDDKKFISNRLSDLDGWTAIYDISAHTVYLPNGATLEAHSGLGYKLDNPRYVHQRMQGATQPHLYNLALREKPFHGVRALRLNPIGGNENIFGRTGLLAHTYMLGPKGHSNGCVVFKNYDAFLQAFENGEVKRLAVVTRMD